MFGFLQRRPNRGVVFKLGGDDKWRWRVVEVDEADAGKEVLEKDQHRTVFADTIQDGYHNANRSAQDAFGEIARWCPLNKVGWYVEHDAKLHQVRRVPRGIELPSAMQED